MPAFLTSEQLIVGLQIAVLVMLIVLLYHSLFLVVSLRKIFGRVDDVTKEVETVIMKPLSMADKILQWFVDFIEEHQKKHHRKHHRK